MSEKRINESLMRDSNKKQMEKLFKTVKKSGGDIGMRVHKDEKTKQTDMPNSFHIDNPFGSGRKIDTYEGFTNTKTVNESKLEDFYSWVDSETINLNDDSWIKGTKEDFERPMFKNLPNHKDRFPYDVLRSGKFIETKDGKIIGQIGTMKNTVVTLDIIDDEHKHQTVEYEVKKLVKKLKNNEIQLTDNSTSKNVKIDTPFGTKFNIKKSE